MYRFADFPDDATFRFAQDRLAVSGSLRRLRRRAGRIRPAASTLFDVNF
jgi:hypothetical protein